MTGFPALAAAPYFAGDTISPALIAPPAAVGSDVWKHDIDTIIALQKAPDLHEIEAAASERTMSPELVVLPVMPQLTRDKSPAFYAWLDRVGETSRGVTDKAKGYWNTKRPYLMDARVKSLIKAHSNPAYPSGHTSGSYVWAYALSMLFPEKRADFIARAEEIAQHRVVVGMHYPHDVQGGRELALLIIGGLVQQSQFKDDMAKARSELSSQGLPQ